MNEAIKKAPEGLEIPKELKRPQVEGHVQVAEDLGKEVLEAAK